MCQREVLKLLEETNDWLSTGDISKELGVKATSIFKACRSFHKFDMIEKKYATGKNACLWRIKHE